VRDIPSYRVAKRGMLNTLCARLYSQISFAMKGKLPSRCSEIHKLKFISPLYFGNFKHCSENVPVTASESLLKSCGRYFDSVIETELQIIYSSEEFLRK
jgi:hypothetical protein